MEIEINATYGQICLFDPGLKHPINDWDQEHERQGFTWRHGSVSFAVPDKDGDWLFRVEMGKFSRDPSLTYRRITSVPFTISERGVEIGGVFLSQVYDLAEGDYNLTYSLIESNDSLQGALQFGKTDKPDEARIHLKDELIDPPAQLKMTAVPA